jgi:hypothetical protein
MGRKSTFTAVQKHGAVMGVISKGKTVSQTCQELGIWRDDVRAVA